MALKVRKIITDPAKGEPGRMKTTQAKGFQSHSSDWPPKSRLSVANAPKVSMVGDVGDEDDDSFRVRNAS